MKIFNIIRESSNPVKKPLYIVKEADEDESRPAEQQSTSEEVEQTETEESEEETTEEQEETHEDENEPADDGDENMDDGFDGGDDDYSDDGGSGGSYETNTEDGQSADDTPEEKKNRAIFNDSIVLYRTIKDTISRLQDLNHSNIITNRVIMQVKRNLSDMLDLLYRFITEKHELQAYEQNLYTYNYFIEAYKINAKMIEKMGEISDTQ